MYLLQQDPSRQQYISETTAYGVEFLSGRKWPKLLELTHFEKVLLVCKLAHAVLYGPEDYQGLAVKNPDFPQEIIHINAFLNEAVCNSSIGQLLRANAEAFRVEIGIFLFLLHQHPTTRILLRITYLPAGINSYEDIHQTAYTSSISLKTTLTLTSFK